MVATAISFALYLFGITWRPLLYAGFVVQTGYLAWRGISLGRLPLVGVHDTLGFLSASSVAFSLALYPSVRKQREFFQMLAGLAALFTALALLQQPHTRPLPPVLKTYWFELHVALSFFSYALFGLGAILGVIYLRGRESLIEKLQYKSLFIGYSFFSLSMFFGGIWAWLAWGTYWLWTPKELWTSLLWVFYGFYLHARLRNWWVGRPSAILGIVGFFVVMFTYLGVGLLMKSSHAF
jgi:ABC-type transport system involved in cytochrome c biogenesis permease subunit